MPAFPWRLLCTALLLLPLSACRLHEDDPPVATAPPPPPVAYAWDTAQPVGSSSVINGNYVQLRKVCKTFLPDCRDGTIAT